MTAADKDTIYIDIDDEITGIIDKFNSSDGKVVALVLPKRAAVLQSIVNMKLLKRAADQSKKNLVLITTEASLMPLAGAVGVHVAKTLTSKPGVPSAPVTDDREETVDEAFEDGETPDFSKEAVAGAAVGDLAGVPPKPEPIDDVETLELDDDDDDEVEDTAKTGAVAGVAAKAAKIKKDKKLHVPDFDRFRWLLLLAVVLIPLLGYGLFYALSVAPKASITIATDAVNVNANFGLTVSTTAKSVDVEGNIVPGKLQTLAKTYTAQGSATGQKNQGDKASGEVTVTNCSGADITIPAGTGLSSGGLTFIAQHTVVVPDSNYKSQLQGGACKNDGQADVTVKAQTGGTNYNLSSGAKFAVSGRPATVTGVGSSMTGGTDDIIKVVSQTDIDNAKAKIATQEATVKQTLITQLQQSGYFAIKNAFTTGEPTTTTTVNVGDQAESFTVNQAITYGMFGAKKADLAKLVDAAIEDQIDTSKQTILSEGLDSASFTITSSDEKSAEITLQTVATAGPDLDVNDIKQQAAGQKAGGLKSSLESQPGVTSVQVKLSPFWVTSVPKKESKITVTIAKPTAPVNNDD